MDQFFGAIRAVFNGQAFGWDGRMNLKNARFLDDPRPIDESSAAYAGRHFSRAYLRHLVKSGEILGMMALTAINLGYYQSLMAGARAAISAGRLADFITETREGWARGERDGTQK